MGKKKCPVCGGAMIRYGKTKAGSQRWQCPACKATSTNRIDNTAKLLQLFLSWLLSGRAQDELSVSAKTFRRKCARFWEVWPIPPVTGKFSYDEKTRTLTLNSLKANTVRFHGDRKFKLVFKGTSEARIVDDFDEYDTPKYAAIAVSGKGKLSGAIDMGGDLTVKGGQIGVKKYKAGENDAAIRCGNLTVKGGKVAVTECSGDYGLSVTGYETGGVNYRGKTSPIVYHDGNMTVSGGLVVLSVYCRHALTCGNKFTLKKGLEKGTYKIKVRLTAPAGANYKAAKAKTITLTVKVK